MSKESSKAQGKLSLSKIDAAADERGGVIKLLWQILKFLLVGGMVTIIQLVLVNVLYFAMRDWGAPLPTLLGRIFTADTVGVGHDNWGYVLPFFLSNLIANIYGYIQNRKTTFRSDAPAYCFAIYIALMVCLILFSAWMQGVLANALIAADISFFANLAPTIAAAAAGFMQMLVLFPMEKFVLLKEKKQ